MNLQRIAFSSLLLLCIGCSKMTVDDHKTEDSIQPLTLSEVERLEEHRPRLWADPSVSERTIHERYHGMIFGHSQKSSLDDRFTLGVALGDVMVKKSRMEWCTVKFNGERHFALHYSGTSILVFPIAMIDKRVDAGDPINLKSLGESTIAAVEEKARDPEYQRP